MDEEGAMADAVAQTPGSSREVRGDDLMSELRSYLLLLAILAATVTYVAGLNPPGGVWLDTQAGHVTGNQILVVAHHARYNAFSYSNATAFMASAVVILLLLIFKEKKDTSNGRLHLALRLVMVLDLLALLVAYAAGASRDTLTTVLASLLVSPIFVYVLLHAVEPDSLLSTGLKKLCAVCSSGDQQEHAAGAAADAPCSPSGGRGPAPAAARGSEEDIKEDKRRRKILMLLAIFATTITYTSGLNPPGGFWTDTQGQPDGHRAGDPVLQHRHRRRFAVFFVCNTISFVASLAVMMLLLTNRFNWKVFKHLVEPLNASAAPYASVWVSLVGLVGAYAAGSCREKDSTAGVIALDVAGAGLVLALVVHFARVKQQGNGRQVVSKITNPTMQTTQTKVEKGGETKHEDGQRGSRGLINTAPSLLLLLATLAATVTYQGGLNPPGGFWPDDRDGHKGGDPILLSKHAARYRLFFYFNSAALAASLLVIFMILMNHLNTRSNMKKKSDEQGHLRAHAVILEVVMILDLMGLIGAFAAGCCRDVSTSIYVVALAGATLVYVVFHIVLFTLHRDDLHLANDDATEEKRKKLLTLAIFAVTLTYQAGLTPPGGFWLGDVDGHHAGDPVLLSNYPRRYTAFFYLNATGFMASVALTILLVNPNLYRAAVKCHALHVCMVAALFGLMGAYAAGSSRHVRTSIYMIALIGMVFASVIVLLLVLFMIQSSKQSNRQQKASTKEAQGEDGTANTKAPTEEAGGGAHDDNQKQQSPSLIEEGTAEKEEVSRKGDAAGIGLHTKRRYLMLLGILAASVTYQAGLAPPGGVWPDSNDGHAVGNPILRDSSRHRYHMFFYSNSASFVASVVVIALQLLVHLPSKTTENKSCKPEFLVQTAQWMMVLDLVGLLLAYAAGSSREWGTSGYIVLLLVGFCIGIHVLVSCFSKNDSGLMMWAGC